MKSTITFSKFERPAFRGDNYTLDVLRDGVASV